MKMIHIFNSSRINPPCLLRRNMKESHGTEPSTRGSWNFWVNIVKWNRIKDTQLVSGNCLVVWKTHTHTSWVCYQQMGKCTPSFMGGIAKLNEKGHGHRESWGLRSIISSVAQPLSVYVCVCSPHHQTIALLLLLAFLVSCAFSDFLSAIYF